MITLLKTGTHLDELEIVISQHCLEVLGGDWADVRQVAGEYLRSGAWSEGESVSFDCGGEPVCVAGIDPGGVVVFLLPEEQEPYFQFCCNAV